MIMIKWLESLKTILISLKSSIDISSRRPKSIFLYSTKVVKINISNCSHMCTIGEDM